MRFLAVENIFPALISHLFKSDHAVKAIQDYGIPGATDDTIIGLAIKEERAIITLDKHFGDILRYPPQNLSGIILIRIHPPLLKDIIFAIDNLFKNYNTNTFKGRLVYCPNMGIELGNYVRYEIKCVKSNLRCYL